MSVKYNSVDRLRGHGTGSSIIRRLRDAAAWLTFTPKTGDGIAGFMLFGLAAPAWEPVRIRTCASQGR